MPFHLLDNRFNCGGHFSDQIYAQQAESRTKIETERANNSNNDSNSTTLASDQNATSFMQKHECQILVEMSESKQDGAQRSSVKRFVKITSRGQERKRTSSNIKDGQSNILIHNLSLESGYKQYRNVGNSDTMNRHGGRGRGRRGKGCWKYALMPQKDGKEEPEYTTYTHEHKGCVDYIFYDTTQLDIKELLELPSSKTLSMSRSIPRPNWSSDHLLLGCLFVPSTEQKQSQFAAMKNNDTLSGTHCAWLLCLCVNIIKIFCPN